MNAHAVNRLRTPLLRAIQVILGVAFLGGLSGHSLAAQEIVVMPADGTIQPVPTGAELTIPIVVDMSGAGSMNVAALSILVRWDTDHLSFVSVSEGEYGNVVFNEELAGAGELQIGLFSAVGTAETFTLASVAVQGVAEGLTLLDIQVTAAGTEESEGLMELTYENPTLVCVGITGTYGDVDGSGEIDILDAHQVARYAAGLSVTDQVLLSGVGDVTADGAVNVVDAQQLARFSIDLSTIGRIGDASASCAVPSMRVVAGNGQSTIVGLTLEDLPTVEVTDETGAPIEHAPVTWTVTGGGGSVSAPRSLTDRDGLATVEWTVGGTPGTNTVEVGATWRDGTVEMTSEGEELVGGYIAGRATVMHRPINPASIDSLNSGPPVPLAQYDRPEYTPDDLIVTFHTAPIGALPLSAAASANQENVQPATVAIRQLLATHELPDLVQTAGVSPVIAAARVKVSDPDAIDSVAAALRSDPAVRSVERNFIVYLDEGQQSRSGAVDPVTANDPDYAAQAWHYGMIDLPEAWTMTTGTEEVTVAVIDDGIRFDHPGIAANLTNDGYDFVSYFGVEFCDGVLYSSSQDGDGYDPDPTCPAFLYTDESGRPCYTAADGNHGLHVAGTVGAVGNDALGGTGVNWNLRIRPLRAISVSGGAAYDIAQAILYAAGLPADDGNGGTIQPLYGARIINMSLGGPFENENYHDAVIAASNAGSLIIAAAGNNANTEPMFPAAWEETLGVSAVGPDGVLASYSTWGTMIDIAAPGGDLSDGDATFGVYSTAWNFVDGLPIWSSQIWNGTSMAAPHVSGVAALLLAANPSLTREELWDRLVNYAVDAGSEGFDTQYGHGILNAYNSLTETRHLPVGDLYARLYDASDGSLVQEVSVGPGGGFQFYQTDVGSYWVFAGEDFNSDGAFGMPGRRWGAFGGVTSPTVIEVAGPSAHDASFAFGLPAASALGDVDNPHQMFVGTSYLDVVQSEKWATFEVLEAGSYTVETFPWDGACGYALEATTAFVLRSGTTPDDVITWSSLNDANCSTATADLTPGTHYVAVHLDGSVGQRYGLYVRRNP